MGRKLVIGVILLLLPLAVRPQLSGDAQRLMKARYLLSENQYGQALDELQNVTLSGPDADRLALVMGSALSGLHRPAVSNEWLEKVTGAVAAEAWYRMARNYMDLKNTGKAMEYLAKHLGDPNHRPKKDIVTDPAFSGLDSDRDWIRLWQKDWYSQAEQQVYEALYLAGQGQVDEAENILKQLIANDNKNPSAYFALARIDNQVKDPRAFRNDFDRAWQLSDGNTAFREDMLDFAASIEYYDQVNRMAADLLRTDPTNPSIYIVRALARIVEGRATLAVQEMTPLEEAGIAPAELYYQAGKKIAATVPLQADAFFTKAIGEGNLDARYFYARGLVRETLEQPDSCLSDLAMSLDINPDQPELYLDRARIRYDLGDTEGACHDWRKALELGSREATEKIYRYCR